ncbi:alanine--glyoxylate aminotransferase family protein [Solimonas sp. K1W22B-7]|uniref:aminotransferase class V-fold PLP-dependent enzyme n=1 Tax=Solimonas sp. K1W22B-7 TaxID=2303331 RepID=UPI000E33118A|nr:aminotransferase class V-fold PLP-dependent enzyme [Solimonas sp. K1W22B-7]AXQ29412.1 alanine--glyoxylate aminotransferase family protein [Solimonas sp. K1W22B-7]
MSRHFRSVDPDGLLEYSVVFSDRAVNHMSKLFQQAMRDISATLKDVYKAEAVAVVPGGGSFGMEAIARQFAGGKNCMVIRNGWFSYRWSQVFEMGSIPSRETVLKARQAVAGPQAPYAPAPIEEVEEAIRREQPDLVFAPHVETASGMILPDDYLQRVAAAVHAHGGLFVLDCVASGAIWVDMRACGIDLLLTAPQKVWSSTPCAALVMLSAEAKARIAQTQSSSFAADLKKWLQIMQAYEDGGHAYHATMPTEGLLRLRDSMNDTLECGLETLRESQWALGRGVRAMLAELGYPSVAAAGFEAPGVVVSYTSDAELSNAKKFVALGLQTAAGVPLMCDEGADFRSFRVGLFGLDKLKDVAGTVQRLRTAVEQTRG